MSRSGYPKGTCVTCGKETSTCYTPQCRSCYYLGKKPTPESIEKQRKIVSEYNRKYSLSHRKEINAYKLRKYHKQTPEERRNKVLKRVYGITLEDFEGLYMVQNGLCPICNKFLGHDRKKMHMDHNHKTGKIRLILCPSCNSGLGFFKDNINSLKNAIKYLGGSL